MRAQRTRRPAVVPLLLRLGAAGAAVFLTVALSESTSSAAFTGGTTDGGNKVTAATDFCTSPGSSTLTATADTTAFASQPTSNAGGTATSLTVISANTVDARTFLRFSPLPSVPSGCVLTAVLKIRASAPTAGRFIDVYRVDPAAAVWTEASITWNTKPAHTGSPVSSASLGAAGVQQWTVTPLMSALYAGVNNGFVVRDQTEGTINTAYTQSYDSREAATVANRPQLVLTWN